MLLEHGGIVLWVMTERGILQAFQNPWRCRGMNILFITEQKQVPKHVADSKCVNEFERLT